MTTCDFCHNEIDESDKTEGKINIKRLFFDYDKSRKPKHFHPECPITLKGPTGDILL